MSRNKTLLLIFFVTLCFSKAQGQVKYDSLYIDSVKKFILKEFKGRMRGNQYTQWDNDTAPNYYIYFSKTQQVAWPYRIAKSNFTTFYYCGHSVTRLNKRFAGYAKDAQCFIMFHELMHNYLEGYNTKLPYEFNEAVGDVLGSYGSLEFSKFLSQEEGKEFKKQIEINEGLYQCFNECIAGINSDSSHPDKYWIICRSKINSYLPFMNSFQKDRFNWPVNNAYLLKNSNYCKNYFLLRDVFLKQKSVAAFLKIIKKLPSDPDKCRKVLNGYL